MLGPQPPDVIPEPGDRPFPPDPLRQHRRGHLQCSASSARTLLSNGENDVGARSYFGGTPDATARATVDRPIPRSRATWRCGTPSATSRRIRAQSSTEITHPICLGSLVFERVATASLSSVADTVTQARRGMACVERIPEAHPALMKHVSLTDRAPNEVTWT